MATAVTTDTLRSLAGVRAANGCALTVFIDLDPSSTPTPADADTKMNSILAEAEKAADATATGGRDCRMALRDDLQRIRDWWDDDFDRDGARGVEGRGVPRRPASDDDQLTNVLVAQGAPLRKSFPQ